MALIDLADAFNDCVDRLNAGQSVEDCLRAYPDHAEPLRPLLETAALVRQARPAVSLGARARVRERVLRSAAPPRRRWFSAPRGLTLAAASVLVIGFAIALFLLANRDHDPSVRVEPLGTHTPTPTLTAASPTPTLTPTPTAQPSLTATAAPTETAPPSATVTPTHTARPSPTATWTPTPTSPAACLFTVSADSVNLRSGPGTGYATAGSARSGEVLVVLATNAGRSWLEVQAVSRSVWVSASLGTLSGACETLPLATVQPGSGAGVPVGTVAPDTDDDSGGHSDHGDDGDSDADDSPDDGGGHAE